MISGEQSIPSVLILERIGKSASKRRQEGSGSSGLGSGGYDFTTERGYWPRFLSGWGFRPAQDEHFRPGQARIFTFSSRIAQASF